MFSILLIDDDTDFSSVSRLYLEKCGFEVFTTNSRDEGERILHSRHIDCIVQRFFGAESRWMGITSTAQRTDDDKTGPCDLRELEFWVRACIEQNREPLLSFPPLSIDKAERRVLINEKPIGLTPYEFDILYLLASAPYRVFSLAEVYREVWRLPDLGNAQTVRVHLTRMRHKLNEIYPSHTFIEIVWGKGFRFIG